MMVKKLALTVAMVALMSGCATPEERAEAMSQKCDGMGFVRGTPKFSDCLLLLAVIEAQQRQRIATAFGALGQQFDTFTAQQQAQQQAEQLYQRHRFEWRQDMQNLLQNNQPPQPMQRYCLPGPC